MAAPMTSAQLLAATRAALRGADPAAALALLPALQAAAWRVDAADDPEASAHHLLCARALLEQLAVEHLVPGLLVGLPALDLALDAVDLAFRVPPETPGLAALLALTPLPPDRWWTRPFEPARAGSADLSFAPPAAPDPAARAAPAAQDALQAPDAPRAPLRLAAEGRAPRPEAAAARGSAPLLLWDPEGGAGFTADLEAWRFAYPVPPLDGRLSRDAGRALRAAWWVAGALTPAGYAPAPPEAHHFALSLPVLGPEATRVDGPSLGLPAVLALISAWTGAPAARDLAATGQVGLDPTGQPMLLPVAGVAAKAAAWRAAGGRRLAVHPANLPEVPSDLEAVAVDPPDGRGLRRLLAAAGLELQRVEGAADGLSQAEHQAALDRLCRQVRTQAVDDPSQPLREGHSPYQRVADRLRHHLDHLGEALDPPARARATADAIVAYGLAGDRDGAAAMLGRLDALRQEPLGLPPAARVELHIAQVTHLIHGLVCEPPEALPTLHAQLDAEGAALEAALGQVEPWGREAVAGRALSSLGRIALHRGDPYVALPHFADARDAFSRPRQAHELGRCRIYLAMAQRAAGLLDGAWDQLAGARADLDAHTLPYSAPYYSECLLYWRYEVGRLALARGRPAQAHAPLQRAATDARWRGYWPLAGVLRSLALAGDPGAEARLAALEPPQRLQRLHRALLAEARGLSPPDAVVF